MLGQIDSHLCDVCHVDSLLLILMGSHRHSGGAHRIVAGESIPLEKVLRHRKSPPAHCRSIYSARHLSEEQVAQLAPPDFAVHRPRYLLDFDDLARKIRFVKHGVSERGDRVVV